MPGMAFGHYDFATMGPFSELCWDKLYRAEFLKKTGLRFRSGMKQGSDALFNNLLQPYVKRIVKIPDCLYIYRPTRPDSLVNVYKAPDKKGSGFYPALERIDLIAAAYREQGVLERAGITVLNWLNGSIQLFSSNLLNQTAAEKKGGPGRRPGRCWTNMNGVSSSNPRNPPSAC